MSKHIKTPLTPLRLTQLAKNYPHLSKTWYLVASAAFSSCNRYKEIPKVYHLLIRQSMGQAVGKKSVLLLFKTANMMEQYHTVDSMTKIPTVEGEVGIEQKLLTLRLQDAILKSLVITGVPKLINSLTLLLYTIPGNLTMDDMPNSTRTFHESTYTKGDEYFRLIYNKVSDKVLLNLRNSYQDLHDFIINSCYGQIISNTDYISSKDSSLVMIAALVPQDVNPQLKGHLRGSLNVGNTMEEANEARRMALDICEWCEVELEETPVILLSS